jgi:hypothetical protein
MASRDLSQHTVRRCWCAAEEPRLSELLGDPMMLALLAADRVDRRDLDALFDRARHGLQLHEAHARV